jgi:hypothetical protein
VRRGGRRIDTREEQFSKQLYSSSVIDEGRFITVNDEQPEKQ